MANERVSRLVLTFDGEAGTIDQVLNGIKSSMRNAVADIERTTSKVELFGDITRNLPAVQAALDRARERVVAFRVEIDGIKAAGAVPIKALTDGLKEAEKAAAAAQKEFNKQTAELAKLDVQLKAAGVDSKNLAAAQTKLAEASKIATKAAEEQAAKQALGVKTFGDIQPQIAKLNAAFETLRSSGTLSAREISIAQQALNTKIKETSAEVTKLRGSLDGAGLNFSSLLTSGIARFVSFTAVVGTATAGMRESINAAKEYKQSLAEIGTVTNLTEAQLDALGAGARRLSRDIGIDLPEVLKALFEIIRSGVPPENALTVIEVSAKAAKASLTDLATTTKVSAILIDAFGLDVDDLGGAFDKLIQGAHDGGATLKEFAESGAPLLNVARSAGVAFDELVATLTVMTDASNDAAGSAATLTKIIVRLGDPEVRGKLRGLGIETTNLLEVFKQLGERNIPLQQFLDLGIASSKTAASVAALTNNTGKLVPELEKVRVAAGETEKAVAKLYDSPKERAARFDAALHDTAVQFGLLFGSGSRLASIGTSVLNSFSNLFASFREGGPILSLVRSDTGRLVAALLGIKPAAETATKSADATAQALKKAGEEAAVAQTKINAANAALGDTAAKLLTEIQALQAASTRDVADINARAEAQIAALDRSVQKTAETAAATIAIQTKQAADRLAVIQKNEADVLAAVTAATQARERAQRASGVNERQIAAESAKIRIDALAPVLKQYQEHYTALQTLAQGHLAKINSIEAERVSFNEAIEKQLFDIRLQSLSGLDQYAAKVKEIDRLISEARRAGVEGDIASAKKFTDQAIALSGTLREVVNKDGAILVRASEAQQKALQLTGKAADGYRVALDGVEDAAKQGFDATKQGIDEVLPKLTDLQTRYDELKRSIADGLDVQVRLDEQSVSDALSELDRLSAPRTVTLTVQTVQGSNLGGPIVAQPFAQGGPVAQPFAGGGPVTPVTPAPRARSLLAAVRRHLVGGGDRPQAFARGGAVFRRPSWTKVPGSGNADTVPAALPVGSFVIRKAASRFYGDGLLARLARGYAGGGIIGGPPVLPGAPKLGGGTVQAAPNDNFWIKYKDTIAKLRALREASVGTPRPSSGGISLGLWAATLADDFVFYSDTHREQIRKMVEDGFDGWFAGIGVAKSFGLPNVVDGQLRALMKRYAGGGLTDTVPAMLTPGEYVMKPKAVAKYGPGFMHALNNMQVPRGFLDNVIHFPAPRPSRAAAVARFAEGGSVGSQSGAEPRSAPFAGGGGTALTVQIFAQSVDEATVRRDVIPLIEKVMRKGR